MLRTASWTWWEVADSSLSDCIPGGTVGESSSRPLIAPRSQVDSKLPDSMPVALIGASPAHSPTSRFSLASSRTQFSPDRSSRKATQRV
jgi:hypothetical protein